MTVTYENALREYEKITQNNFTDVAGFDDEHFKQHLLYCNYIYRLRENTNMPTRFYILFKFLLNVHRGNADKDEIANYVSQINPDRLKEESSVWNTWLNQHMPRYVMDVYDLSEANKRDIISLSACHDNEQLMKRIEAYVKVYAKVDHIPLPNLVDIYNSCFSEKLRGPFDGLAKDLKG